MRSVLLINPNTSAATTAMMVVAARAVLPPGIALRGIQARRGAAMITDEPALALAAEEVVRMGTRTGDADALVVAAFGDPGVARLRAVLPIPVIGIGEAAIREAAAGGRRFGIATTTPGLVRAIGGLVGRLGLAAAFTGLRVPDADPELLAADPARQADALFGAVSLCMERDGAATVVIGGGPLSDAATRLGAQFGGRIVAPVPAAIRCLCAATPHA